MAVQHQYNTAIAPGDEIIDTRQDERRESNRRHFLSIATAAVATTGLGFVAYPFLKSLSPSAKAQAVGGPVQVDLRSLRPGQMITVVWRGLPIWVVRRTAPMLEKLTRPDWLRQLSDPSSDVLEQQPDYARNPGRAIRDEYFVAVGLCTHLGCVPLFELQAEDSRFSDTWYGGFFCPCHGSRFDLAGRVVKNVPAPTNLRIPPHTFVGEHRLEIGTDYTENPENKHGNA